MCGLKPFAKVLGAYVLFHFFWFSLHKFVTTSGILFSAYNLEFDAASVPFSQIPGQMIETKVLPKFWPKNSAIITVFAETIWKLVIWPLRSKTLTLFYQLAMDTMYLSFLQVVAHGGNRPCGNFSSVDVICCQKNFTETFSIHFRQQNSFAGLKNSV